MIELDVKLEFLSNMLDKKADLLAQVLSITEKQEMFFNLQSPEKEAFSNLAVTEKQKIIDEITNIDAAFTTTFESLDGKLNSNKELYANKINELKNRIKIVSDIDLKIRIREEKNRRLYEISNPIKNNKSKSASNISKNYILEQYRKNNDIY